MAFPGELFHFGQSKHLSDFISHGHISFGLAAGFNRADLTKGQRDDEMKRTASPAPKTTNVLVARKREPVAALQNLASVRVGFGIRVPYFMKCFSLGFSKEMYEEVDGDICIAISDVPTFFARFEGSLAEQLPEWAAFAAAAQYWDFSRVPAGMNQRDLMFLKDAAHYSCQKEYRIVLLPPENFKVTDPNMRQSLYLGSLADIAIEQKRDV